MMYIPVAIAQVLFAGGFLHPVPGGGDRHLSEDPRPRERQASGGGDCSAGFRGGLGRGQEANREAES